MVDEGRLPYGFGVSQQLLVILTEVDLCEFYSRYPDREPSSINREPLIALWQLNVYDRYLARSVMKLLIRTLKSLQL